MASQGATRVINAFLDQKSANYTTITSNGRELHSYGHWELAAYCDTGAILTNPAKYYGDENEVTGNGGVRVNYYGETRGIPLGGYFKNGNRKFSRVTQDQVDELYSALRSRGWEVVGSDSAGFHCWIKRA